MRWGRRLAQRHVPGHTAAGDARALVVVVVILIVTGLLLVEQNMWLTVPIACLACILFLAMAQHAELSLRDIGLGRADLGSGARWGIAAALVVAVGYGLIAVLPLGRAVPDDDSVPTTAAQVVLKILVVIQLRTTLLEELAFRGVMWGLLRRRVGARAATCWSAAAFGLWHVPTGIRLIGSNESLAQATDGSRSAAVGVVLAIVVFTGLSGLLFADLRRRSGSLLAPAGLHWATNGFGTLLGALS